MVNGPVSAAALAPLLAAAILATLGTAVAWLWWRRRDPLPGWLALGLLGWALHLAVGLAQAAGPPGLHQRVAVHGLQAFVVVTLLLFCLQLAQWQRPALVRGLLGGAALTPALLYAAAALGAWGPTLAAGRGVLGALVLVAVLALARAALRASRADRLGLAAVGLAGLAAFWHDADAAAAPLLPWAGVLFGGFMARVLADRSLFAAQGLEVENAALAQRLQACRAELQQAVDAMQRARDTAAAADLAKSRFLAAASHDLRQPAHALGLYLATLRGGPLAPPQAEVAERMAASLAALDGMFMALLDVSRIDSGAVQPQWDVVALAPLLRRLADAWGAAAEARGLRLALHLSASDAVTVTDALLLERVLGNLLANAVKFTRRGGVLLACRRRGGHYRIEVWDSGIGLQPADQERVFEAFVQVGNAARDRAAGLGLGLAIVRRLTGLLQLQLTLHSRPGHGSVFFIDGIAPAAATPRAAAVLRSDPPRLAGTTVAVLEDDAEALDALCRLLRMWQCRVLAGGDAPALLRQSRDVPAVVIADLRLADGRQGPDEVGVLLAAWGRQVPCLYVSGETGAAPLRALHEAGATCLAKPLAPARLRAWLEQALAAPAGDGEQSVP